MHTRRIASGALRAASNSDASCWVLPRDIRGIDVVMPPFVYCFFQRAIFFFIASGRFWPYTDALPAAFVV
jgi:hypothetical protein